MLTPPPKPANTRYPMRAIAVGAVAMRTFASAYVPIPATMKRRAPKRSMAKPDANCATPLAIAKPLVMSPSCNGEAPSDSP